MRALEIRPGQQLLHYRFMEKIGVGGMGVVWAAVDTTLDRQVAVKILPDSFARDERRLSRFQREARILASLNHPNIATVHGLHEAGGVHFIAMELVSGETLARRLGRGAMPIGQALEVARQIAEALEAAHERGVIHRDLKPANIKLDEEERVKVLDFGLAKASGPGATSGDGSESPTVTSGHTEAGAVLGTAAYMSPEQARGKPVDRRGDIWAFGCVLYETLTGKPCFGGETPSDTFARILEREPDWDAVPAGTPAAAGEILRRCLRKDSRRRLRDIGEARIAIEDLQSGEQTGAEPLSFGEIDSRRSWHGVLAWGVAAVMTVLAGLALWTAQRAGETASRSPARLSVSLPRQQQLAVGSAVSLAVSPDGSRLVYAASSPPGSQPSLWVRDLNAFDAVRLPGTEGAIGPFFSPDGRWLGYFSGTKLFKSLVEGRMRSEICDVGQVVPGASWGADDMIFFSGSPETGLFRVPAGGGEPERLTTPDVAKGETGHGWPQPLPDGENALFTIASADGPRIALLSLRTGKWRTLVRGIGGARYLPTGHLIYARPEGLVAVPFDPVRLEMGESPVLILEDVYNTPGLLGFGLAAYAVSDTGLLAYLPGGVEAGESRLTWVDRDGRTTPVTSERGSYEWPRLSPDGKRVAVTDRSPDGRIDIWILDVERDARSRLTLDGSNILPCWTPDGEHVAFGSVRQGSGAVNVYWKPSDGSGEATLLLGGDNPRFPRSWLPDGSGLAITEWNPQTLRDVWVLPMEGSGAPTPVLATPFDEHSPMFSPDGRWLAYVSDESGRNEVYVQSYPAGRGRWLLSAGGGKEPVWSGSGRELFYRNANAMMAVPIRTEPEFSAGKPRRIFQGPFQSGLYDSLGYDVSPDGQLFLMIETDRDAAPDRLNVVLDWRQELLSKVPVGRQ